MGIKSAIGKIGGLLFAITFLVARVSAGEYFIPEGMMLIDGGLFYLHELAETGLYVGGGY